MNGLTDLLSMFLCTWVSFLVDRTRWFLFCWVAAVRPAGFIRVVRGNHGYPAGLPVTQVSTVRRFQHRLDEPPRVTYSWGESEEKKPPISRTQRLRGHVVNAPRRYFHFLFFFLLYQWWQILTSKTNTIRTPDYFARSQLYFIFFQSEVPWLNSNPTFWDYKMWGFLGPNFLWYITIEFSLK